VEDGVEAKQVLALGGLLNPETLTIGFARRFAEYKRPTLIFQDVNRLKRIINNQRRPVQIVFAGKSHPADFSSKHLLHRVYMLAADHEFQGRIAFVEDYDMHMARYLVQGVDVWLNTPRRSQEACGTSGMKASLNGVLHLSVCDGWWHEAYDGTNGWAINSHLNAPRPDEADRTDAEELYRLLEEEIAPLYYTRGRGGVPHGWIRMVKEAIRSVAPMYSTRRMLKEYTEKMYRAAAQAASGIEQS
jgi:starch phosphorylase